MISLSSQSIGLRRGCSADRPPRDWRRHPYSSGPPSSRVSQPSFVVRAEEQQDPPFELLCAAPADQHQQLDYLLHHLRLTAATTPPPSFPCATSTRASTTTTSNITPLILLFHWITSLLDCPACLESSTLPRGRAEGHAKNLSTSANHPERFSCDPLHHSLDMENSQGQIMNLSNLAETFKMRGNKCMQAKLYSDAIQLYTCAIALSEKNAIYYGNRAVAFTEMHRYTEAIQDCSKAIEIDPSYSKAYSRLGLAYYAQGKYKEAMEKGFFKGHHL